MARQIKRAWRGSWCRRWVFLLAGRNLLHGGCGIQDNGVPSGIPWDHAGCPDLTDGFRGDLLLRQPGDELPAKINGKERRKGRHGGWGWDRVRDLDGGDVDGGFAVVLVDDPDAEFTIGRQFEAGMHFAVGIGVDDHVGGRDDSPRGQLGDVLLSAPADGPGGGQLNPDAGVVDRDCGAWASSEDAAVDADTIADLDGGWLHGIIGWSSRGWRWPCGSRPGQPFPPGLAEDQCGRDR